MKNKNTVNKFMSIGVGVLISLILNPDYIANSYVQMLLLVILMFIQWNMYKEPEAIFQNSIFIFMTTMSVSFINYLDFIHLGVNSIFLLGLILFLSTSLIFGLYEILYKKLLKNYIENKFKDKNLIPTYKFLVFYILIGITYMILLLIDTNYWFFLFFSISILLIFSMIVVLTLDSLTGFLANIANLALKFEKTGIKYFILELLIFTILSFFLFIIIYIIFKIKLTNGIENIHKVPA